MFSGVVQFVNCDFLVLLNDFNSFLKYLTIYV
jgi:hypothetical protein